MSIFNRMYRANIVTSGPGSTSKACFVKKLSISFLAPTSWFVALAPHSLRGLHVSIAYPAPISWQKRPCSQSHVKHVSVSSAIAFKVSDRRHHAVEFIRNPVSSLFHFQVFIFTRLSSLAPPWIAIFARKCDCHAMVNSLAIARITISTRNLRLSSLRLHDFTVEVLTKQLACFCMYSHFSLVRTISGKEKILYSRELLVGKNFFKTRRIPLVLPSPVIFWGKFFFTIENYWLVRNVCLTLGFPCGFTVSAESPVYFGRKV